MPSARAYLESAAEPPAVIIADIFLPRALTGLDLLEWLRDQPEPLRTVPVVMLTISTDRTHQMRASAGSAALFLFKPITEDVIVEALRRLGLVMTRQSSGIADGVVVERKG